MDRWDPAERAESLRLEEEERQRQKEKEKEKERKAPRRRDDSSGSSSNSGGGSKRDAHDHRRDERDVERREEQHRRTHSRRSGSRERERERKRSPSRSRSRGRSHSRERSLREKEHERERERDRGRDARRRSRSRSRSRGHSRSRSRSRNRSPRRDRGEAQPLLPSAAPAAPEHSRDPRQRSHSQHSQPHESQPAQQQQQWTLPQQQQQQQSKQSSQQHPPSNHIMIRNLSSFVSEEQLMAALSEHFPACARPLGMRVIRDRDSGAGRGYAFAEMLTLEQAVQLHTQAAANIAAGRPFLIDGRSVQIGYGAVPKNGNNPPRPANPAHPAPAPVLAPAAVVDVAPWDCTRCGTHNEPCTHSCSCCNLARAVMAGGEAAIAAMSTSLASHHAASSAAQLQHHYVYGSHAAVPAAAAAPASAVPTAEESLKAAIAAGQVLFVSRLPPLSTPIAVRDALVPHAAVADVKVLIDESSGVPLDRALVELDSAEECRALRLKFAEQPLRMGEQSVRVETAGSQHLAYAAPGRYISWLVESSAHAAHRLTAAVATAASQQAIFGGEGEAQRRPHGLHDMWQKVVADQTAAYPVLAAGAPGLSAAAQSARPAGLAPSFAWDASSGYWFDAASGYYFDQASCLYYHGATQTYSRWEPAIGQYVVLDQHGQAAAGGGGGSQVAAQYLALKAAQAFEQQAQQQQQQQHAQSATKPDAASAAHASSSSSMPPLESAPVISFSLHSTGSPVLRKPAAVGNAAVASAPTAASSAAAAAAASPSFLDLSRLACLLCHRQLKSLEQLLAHEQKSDLHAKNLAAWQVANPHVVPPPPAAGKTAAAPSPAPIAAAPKPAAAAAVPLSAAEQYKREMAKYNELDRNQGLGQRPLMK